MRELIAGQLVFLETGAVLFRQALAAAACGDEAGERLLVERYTKPYQDSCETARRFFAVFQATLERGGRAASQRLTGQAGHDATTGQRFRTGAARLAARYRGEAVPALREGDALVQAGRYEAAGNACARAETVLTELIQQAGFLDQGDVQVLWDARQALISLLANRLMEARKLAEYAVKTRDGDAGGAAEARKLLTVLATARTDAEAAWKKHGF
jgi:hypothetical protein